MGVVKRYRVKEIAELAGVRQGADPYFAIEKLDNPSLEKVSFLLR